MVERPILFSDTMVRAILEGRKTQTRRIVKPQPLIHDWQDAYMMQPKNGKARCRPVAADWPDGEEDDFYCPYGQPGDRLWVREAFDPILPQDPTYNGGRPIGIDYRASHSRESRQWRVKDDLGIRRWKPSIHMRREYSRILLEITGVRVERLQEISEADAQAEGAPPSHPSIDSISREFGYADFPRSWYGQLWDSINGAGSWAADPWVWVVEFQRVDHANQ